MRDILLKTATLHYSRTRCRTQPLAHATYTHITKRGKRHKPPVSDMVSLCTRVSGFSCFYCVPRPGQASFFECVQGIVPSWAPNVTAAREGEKTMSYRRNSPVVTPMPTVSYSLPHTSETIVLHATIEPVSSPSRNLRCRQQRRDNSLCRNGLCDQTNIMAMVGRPHHGPTHWITRTYSAPVSPGGAGSKERM